MNMCIIGIIATGVETLRAWVKYNMETGFSKYCSEWKIADTGDNGFVRLRKNYLYGWHGCIFKDWRRNQMGYR